MRRRRRRPIARLPCTGRPPLRPRGVTAASVRSTPDVYVIGPFSASAIEFTHGLTQPRTRSSRSSQDEIVS